MTQWIFDYVTLTEENKSGIVKLGFTGVYIIFLISAQKHRLLEPPRWAEILKILEFFILKFSFVCGKILNIFE